MPKIPAKILDSHWTEGDATITTDKGVAISVRAKRYGGIIVHPRVGDNHKPWVVTVSSIGFSATSVDTEADALRIGQLLWDRCCLALRLKTREEVLAKLPEWVAQWCRDCWTAGKYVDPPT